MARTTLFLIVLVLLVVGGAFFLSSRAREVPTERVEIDVTRDARTR